jgi:hypothetical protein
VTYVSFNTQTGLNGILGLGETADPVTRTWHEDYRTPLAWVEKSTKRLHWEDRRKQVSLERWWKVSNFNPGQEYDMTKKHGIMHLNNPSMSFLPQLPTGLECLLSIGPGKLNVQQSNCKQSIHIQEHHRFQRRGLVFITRAVIGESGLGRQRNNCPSIRKPVKTS